MSYKSEPHRILPGSLNLLPPVDKIPEGDCLELLNWRVDQAGVLRSRRGMTRVSNPILFVDADAGLTSIGRRANDLYYGSPPGIYRGQASDPFATSTSSDPFSFVAMNGFMWICNLGLKGRDANGIFSPWTPDAPSASVTPSVGSIPIFNFGPNGTYQFYVTFLANGIESNPGPASDPFTITQSASILGQLPVQLDNLPISTDPTVNQRNVYATGGTLGQGYLVASVYDNTTDTVLYYEGDDVVTEEGIAMEVDHDPPPDFRGIAGPYFSRILGFSSVDHPNRLWWTKPTQPGFFPGASSSIGQWVDVGDDGEKILRVTLHARMAVIYKEHSIWRLIGDPDTGYLEQCAVRIGALLGAGAVVNAGGVDYFATYNGVYRFDLDNAVKISGKVDPIFDERFPAIDAGVIIPPLVRAFAASCVMELVNGEVMLFYPDQSYQDPNTALKYNIAADAWAREKFNYEFGVALIQSTLYPADNGLTWWAGIQAGYLFAIGFNTAVTDDGVPIHVAFQSGYHDQGLPNSDKVYTELVIEYQGSAGDSLSVGVYYDDGASNESLTALAGAQSGGPDQQGAKQTAQYRLSPSTDGKTARNMSLRIEGDLSHGEFVVHAMYLYYYPEARLALSAITIPLDFGTNKVKQVRELELDVDTSLGVASADVFTDLPGNAIAVRDTRAVAASGGRRNFNLPLLSGGAAATFEGRLLRLALTSAAGFRLYSARLLMRILGVYVEGYEGAAGFSWDSQEQSFTPGKIGRARELELEIDTRGGDVTASLLSDLPGNAMATRTAPVVNTGGAGRRIVKLPLPANVEGRLYELRLSGSATYVLFGARIELLAVGVYIEAYEAAAGAVYDSREIDFGSQKLKDARELEVDLETTGAVTVTLYGDASGQGPAARFTASVTTGSSGRRKINLPLTVSGQESAVEARLWRLVISGVNAFRLYGAALRLREIGHSIDTDASTGAAMYDTSELDLGSKNVKQFRTLEVEIATTADVTASFLTDLPGGALTPRLSQAVNTSATGMRVVRISLPQGAVPDNYLFGRLMRLTLAGTARYKLLSARVEMRVIGTYVEAYEAVAGAVWDSSPLDLGQPQDKVFDQIRFEMDSDGACSVTVWTDLPGETLTSRFTASISTAGFGRRWVTMPLPADTHGRLIKVVVSSASAFRLYQGAVSRRIIGRYLAAGVNDTYRSLDENFGTERVKLFKYLEADIQTDGPLTLTLYTDGPPPIAQRCTATINTGGVRMAVKLRLPGNVRGRLARVEIGGANSGRLYALRAWAKTTGEPSQWDWISFPVETSSPLAEWAPLPVAPTAAEFQWAQLPVETTAPDWSWQPFPVTETAAQWSWASFPVEETPDTWKWVDVPVGSE